MTLQQLKYFIEMSKTLHYTRAAENLNISQPSLSYSINQLSVELGAPLFNVSGKKVNITTIGEAFLPYAESALSILEQGEQQIQRMLTETGGNISLGYIYSVSFDVIPKLIDDFYLHRGDRNIHFILQVNMTDSLIDQLIENKVDALVAPLPEVANDAIESIPIFRQTLYLMVYNDHPLANRQSVSIKDLSDEKMIMMNKKTNLYMITEAMFKKQNIIPETEFIVDECNSMAAFISANLGIGIMPKVPALDNFKVVALPFSDPGITRTINLLWNRQANHSPAVRSFIEFYQAAIE